MPSKNKLRKRLRLIFCIKIHLLLDPISDVKKNSERGIKVRIKFPIFLRLVTILREIFFSSELMTGTSFLPNTIITPVHFLLF